MYWNYIFPYEHHDRRRLNNTAYITGCFPASGDIVDYGVFRLTLANFQGASLSFSPFLFIQNT